MVCLPTSTLQNPRKNVGKCTMHMDGMGYKIMDESTAISTQQQRTQKTCLHTKTHTHTLYIYISHASSFSLQMSIQNTPQKTATEPPKLMADGLGPFSKCSSR